MNFRILEINTFFTYYTKTKIVFLLRKFHLTYTRYEPFQPIHYINEDL